MIAETPGRGSRLFPEICINLRTGRRPAQISLPPAVQVAAASAVVAFAVAVCYFIVGRSGYERAVADKQAAVVRTETANADLQDEVASLRDKLALAAREREQATADLDRALTERDRLRARIAEIEQNRSQVDVGRRQKWTGVFRLAGLIETEPSRPAAGLPRPEMLISDAPPEPQDQSRSVADLARQAVAEVRRLLASTGLNVDRLFPQLAQDRGGLGGPFVAPPKADPPDAMTPDNMEELRSLMKSLPLSVPLDYYQLESRFGPRHDPFNHRSSFHTGIDLSAPYMSPVHATAAGIVTYAGYRSDYGKVVEIDHGNGIATLYAHLHRYIVSVGQRVAEHEQVGFLGSSGRSSGPHVHYEVRVNDEPQDPEKFIGLARVMPAAER
ncbi:MAG TPA: peptidoglycan DD-metalloendopeptidase family protein [Stellaceae bacterium]|nr:peptidoglycan DD-metalloendopeptidase family protein [Stellaceae bacterium]